MTPLNFKIIPLAILTVVASYLTFATITNLIGNIEIIFQLEEILRFLISVIVLLSLTSILISLTLALLQNTYYRIGFFFLIFLPYASVFILTSQVEPLFMGIFLLLFAAMSATIFIEFDRAYANQIKAHLGTPAKSNVRTLAFFLALTAALAFYSINSNSTNQEALTDKIINDITVSTTEAIQKYGLMDRMIGQSQLGQLGQAVPTSIIQSQFNAYIENQITTMIEPYRPYIIYILTVLVFATITAVSTFAAYLTLLISVGLIPLLESSGYIKETKQMVEVTRLTL